MTPIGALFDELLVEHDRIGSPLRAYLRSGESAEAVRGLLRDAGIDAPPEVVEWFGAHDGVETGRWSLDSEQADGLRAIDGGQLLDVRTAISVRGQVSAFAAVRSGLAWREAWLPIMRAGPELWVVDSGEPGCPVWRVGTSAQHRVAPDLAAFVNGAVADLRAGVYVWDGDAKVLIRR